VVVAAPVLSPFLRCNGVKVPVLIGALGVSRQYDSCLTEDALSELPDLTFSVADDVTISLPADNYLIAYEGCYYWGTSASTMAIFGNVAMQGLTVVYDRDDNKLGFATVRLGG
jgi:hypothetical protein